MKKYSLFLISILAGQTLISGSSAVAENMKGDVPHVHDYDEIVTPDMETARSVINRARVSLRNGNVSRALALAQRAMKMDDDDMEIHCIYAQALEAKVERQTERDPYLFKKCISEWIKVYRNEVGMEKGMTFKGLNVMGNMYNDDEYGNLAKKHLIKLTGYAPKLWETDNHFITRTTKEVETAVSGKVRSSTRNNEEEDETPPPTKPRRQRVSED